MDIQNENIYQNLTQKPPNIKKEFLSSILCLPNTEVIESIDIMETTESNTSAIIKLCVKIKQNNVVYLKRLFIKTAKTEQARNAYHDMCIKEARFYEAVKNIKSNDLSVPKCYYVYASDETANFFIIFEDISKNYKAPENVDMLNKEVWLSCAESLGVLHAAFWNLNEKIKKPSAISEKQLNENIINNNKHLDKFFEYVGGRFNEHTHSIFQKAMEITNKRITKERQSIIREKNVTVINGDSHIYNFMLPVYKDDKLNAEEDNYKHVNKIQNNKLPKIIDFQFWGVGYGAGDLAHLTRVNFPNEYGKTEHKQIAERYHQTLLNHGVTGYSWDECLYDYRMNVASMVMIPVWQYSFFNLKYEEWVDSIENLIKNYNFLDCDELL